MWATVIKPPRPAIKKAINPAATVAVISARTR
jgi:hypothetical protein